MIFQFKCKFFRLFVLLLINVMFCLLCNNQRLSKFTNLQCISSDINITKFHICRLRAIKRDVNELTIKAALYRPIIANATMRWQLMKKANGYKPFLYDVTVDTCKYFEQHKNRNPFINVVLTSITDYATAIDKCPIQGNLSVNNFRFPIDALVLFPLPMGEYGIYITFNETSTNLAIIKVYFILPEEL